MLIYPAGNPGFAQLGLPFGRGFLFESSNEQVRQLGAHRIVQVDGIGNVAAQILEILGVIGGHIHHPCFDDGVIDVQLI